MFFLVSAYSISQSYDNNCNPNSIVFFNNWTELRPADSYMRIIKKNNTFYLRTSNEVYTSPNINGPWTNLNFQSQTGSGGNNSLRTLEVTSSGDIVVSTPAAGIYRYTGGSWSSMGLSGAGTNGMFAKELENNRLLVMRAGFLRDLYITDNNGANWTNVTNGNTDWFDCLITDDDDILVSVGNAGLIRSVDNGISFQNINSTIGTSKINSITKDCNGSIYAVTDNGIFSSSDNGSNWSLVSALPISSNSLNQLYSNFIVASEGFYLFHDGTAEVLKVSSNGGGSWDDIMDYPGDISLITYVSEIDGNIVICGLDGIWAKKISYCPSSLFTVQPNSQQINVNDNAEFTVSSSDPQATYQWQTDLGVGFQNLNNVGQYTGVTYDTLNISNVTMSNNNQPFRCIINSGSCPDTSEVAVLTVNDNVGLSDVEQDDLFSIYPNPAHNQITITVSPQLIHSNYVIYDNMGRSVLSGKINSESTLIDLESLNGGVYFLQIGENLKQTVKLMKVE